MKNTIDIDLRILVEKLLPSFFRVSKRNPNGVYFHIEDGLYFYLNFTSETCGFCKTSDAFDDRISFETALEIASNETKKNLLFYLDLFS